MSEIALKFLLANLAAGLAILVVAALRKPARATFGAGLAYGLWLLVPLAALASLAPPRVVEIVRPAPVIATPISPEPALAANAALAEERVEAAAAPRTAIFERPLPPIAPDYPPLDPWTIATLAWLAGAAVTLAWQLRNQSRFMADARAGFAGPAVAGLFRPRIITPADFEDRFDPSEREVVLAHETIHLDRNDARINAVVALARCACWFNPLIHLAAHLMRMDQELACDAAVVARYPRARSAYATALLKAELAARPLPLGCYWPARSEHPLTERIEMLKRTAPGRARRLAGVAAILVLAAATSAAAWAALPPQQRLVDAAPKQAAPEQTAPVIPAPAPQQTPAQPRQPSPPTPASPSPVSNTPSRVFGQPAPLRLDVDSPVVVRGTVERLEFGASSYVVLVRASAIAQTRIGAFQPNTDLWALLPVNYFGNREAIEADLKGKAVEARGLNINKDCKPDCRIRTRDLLFARSSEAPAPGAADSLLTFFAQAYDTGQYNSAVGKVERLVFHDNNRTFDIYVRSEGSNVEPSRLFQVRMEYRQPRADIERQLAGKTVVARGWRAKEWPGTYCDPCGMMASSLTERDDAGPLLSITPDGATLAKVIAGRPAVPPMSTAEHGSGSPDALRIVALKRERLEISSRDLTKFVDRYFEPGDYYLVSTGGDWVVSTPDGAAFEWRWGDASFEALGNAGPVSAVSVDAVADRVWRAPAQPAPQARATP